MLGHVDATGRIVDMREDGEAWRLEIDIPDAIEPLVIPKGSIAVDGISLTIARLDAASFDVQIVPHTLANTTLRAVRPGTPVNLECDVLGKYVNRAVSLALARPLVAHP